MAAMAVPVATAAPAVGVRVVRVAAVSAGSLVAAIATVAALAIAAFLAFGGGPAADNVTNAEMQDRTDSLPGPRRVSGSRAEPCVRRGCRQCHSWLCPTLSAKNNASSFGRISTRVA